MQINPPISDSQIITVINQTIMYLLNANDNYVFSGESISPTMNFIQLGLDSINLTDLISMLNQKLNIDLEIEIIFDNCSVKELASYIMQLGKV
jgi:acyl carrier protein